MSKHGLIETIRSQAASEIKTIEQQTREKVSFLEDEIKIEEKKTRLGAVHLGKLFAETQIELDKQGLQTRFIQTLQNLQWETIHSIFAQVESSLKQLRDHPGTYQVLFKRLLSEALDKLIQYCPQETQIIVHIDPRDQKIFETTRMGLNVSVTVETDLITLGGVIVRNKDGSISIDNRLEERFQRCRPLFIKKFIPEFAKVFKISNE